MKALLRAALYVSSLLSVNALAASSGSEFSGRWEVTTSYPGGSYVAGLDLTGDADHYTGRSGYLVPDWFWFKYVGGIQKDGLHLQVLAPDGTTVIGELLLAIKSGVLSGRGSLRSIPVAISGHRPLTRPGNAPTVHTYEPQVYYRTFSGANPPALHIFPGDTVQTKTLDAGGYDEKRVRRGFGGNPQTGPFYIEGAMIGDTIAVHFNKIRPNRDTAFQNRAGLSPGVLPPEYIQTPVSNWSDIWKLDREHGTATADQPSEKLKNFTVRLKPMLGCVGVAPYFNQAIASSDLGPYGGNMDYNQIVEGTTLYLPVYQAGALLMVGDGHALQEDGEITGQGFETSMDVEFTVDLLPNELLDQAWAENTEYIMVSGVGGSMTAALQIATAGLSNWLKAYYQLDTSEVATVLAASVHYDIAEVVDPEVHVVAKIGKDVLQQIPKPEKPSQIFCQPRWGCRLN
jgi:amidase